MDADTLTQSVDKSQMPPLHQKRVLAFINHFIINSCTFLNDFAVKCETKFIDLERKMQKVEAALTIIEAKLASVPDLVENTPPVTANTNIAEPNHNEKTENAISVVTVAATETNDVSTSADNGPKDDAPPPEPVGVRACEDIRYKKFFKMVQFGVPAEAVKMKMQADGIEPIILDTPNLLLTDGVTS